LNQLCLSVFNTDQNGWQLLPGEYNVTAGPSSSDTPLKATLHVHP
jgi:beta-glucosidase